MRNIVLFVLEKKKPFSLNYEKTISTRGKAY